MCRWLLAVALLVPALALAETAPAQPSEADARFERGVKLFDAAKGDARMYEAALTEFDAAYRLSGDWKLLFNMGVTQRKLARLGEAIRTFERYLKEGGERIAPERRAAVEKEIRDVRALVGEVQIRVDGPPADLWLDGRPLGKSPMAEPLLLVSGSYGLRATRDGYLPAEKQLAVLSGGHYDVDLTPAPRPKTVAELSVTSTPPSASLFLDQKPLGRAPWKGELEPGGHTLSVEAEGYERQSLDLVLAAGQRRDLAVELVPPTPFYKRWYFWTAVGAVLAGGAAGTYAVTHPLVDQGVRLP